MSVEQALQAAFEGPEIKGVEIRGHDFNVKKMDIHRDGAGTVGSGRISHRLAHRPDDQVDYTITVSGGQVTAIDANVEAGGWSKIWGTIAFFLPDSASQQIGIEEHEITDALRESEKLFDGNWQGAMKYMLAVFATRLASGASLHQMTTALSVARELPPTYRILGASALAGQPFGEVFEVQGGGLTDRSVSAVEFNDQLYVFGRGIGDSRIYMNAASYGQPFRGWQEVPGNGVTKSAMTSASFAGHLVLLARGLDNDLCMNIAQGAAAFGEWSPLGDTKTTRPFTAAVLRDRLFVAGVGTDRQMYIRSSPWGQRLEPWVQLDSSGTSRPLALAPIQDHLYLLATDDSGRIYGRSGRYGEPFGGWSEVQGGGVTDRGVAAATFAGRLYVAAKGVDDGGVYLNSAAWGEPFVGWSSVPGLQTKDAPALAVFRDRLYAFGVA